MEAPDLVTRYDWVWDGSWTNELEESVLNLLVALDDAFAADGGVLALRRSNDGMVGDHNGSSHLWSIWLDVHDLFTILNFCLQPGRHRPAAKHE